jgi:hypothetical protein
MDQFTAEFMKRFGPDVTRHLSTNLGLKPRAAQQVVPEIIPMILGGLKRQMQTQGGPARLDHILNKYGSPDVLGRIGEEMSARARQANPDPRLGGLLGESGVQATQVIGQKFGIDPKKLMSLIPMLAPLILGALSQKKSQGGTGLDGLAGMIDRDGDGDILDDIGGFLTKGLGSGSGGGGILGGLLGSLFGRRR